MVFVTFHRVVDPVKDKEATIKGAAVNDKEATVKEDAATDEETTVKDAGISLLSANN